MCCTRCKIGFGFSGLGSVALGARGQGFVLHAVFGFGSGECVALWVRGVRGCHAVPGPQIGTRRGQT